jgi:hypothetical protein
MTLIAKVLLLIQMSTATPGSLGVWEQCDKTSECGSELSCDMGVCTPDIDCQADSDCPADPDGYSVVCVVNETCEGSAGTCRLGPGAYNECPLWLDLNDEGWCELS